jgi:peptidoglycan/xylan/chitin deacetylase (PgdA/CDA1 family)
MVKAGLYKIRRSLNRFYAGLGAGSKAGGIAITFDDAYVEEWYSIKGLLNQYGAKVTFFVSHFDRLTEDSVEKLRILRDEGHEIGFHGLRHLNAVTFVKEHSVDKYLASEILPGIEAMACAGFHPVNFSYPYGAHTKYLDDELFKHFNYVRGTIFTNEKERIPDLDYTFYKHGDEKIIYGAGIDNAYNNSVEEIQKGLNRANEKNEILILYAHKTSDEMGDYCVPTAKLEGILKYASENRSGFYRINDL